MWYGLEPDDEIIELRRGIRVMWQRRRDRVPAVILALDDSSYPGRVALLVQRGDAMIIRRTSPLCLENRREVADVDAAFTRLEAGAVR